MWMRNETDIAQAEINSLQAKLTLAEVPPTAELINSIYQLLANDLNSAAAISAINQWVASEGSGGDSEELRRVLDGLLGIALTA
jgi:hypothetical protein